MSPGLATWGVVFKKSSDPQAVTPAGPVPSTDIPNKAKFPDDGLIGSPLEQRVAMATVRDFEQRVAMSAVKDFVASLQQTPTPPRISTAAVIQSLLKYKETIKHIKPSSMKTYKKRYPLIIRHFSYLPTSLDEIYEFLDHFNPDPKTGKYETGRYKKEYFSYLKEILKHAVRFFDFPKNQLDGIDSPTAEKKPIRTLSLEQFARVNQTPESPRERAAWELLGGHGWRQVEVIRLTAGDVRQAAADANNLIYIRGKEREEYGPILSETLSLLMELASNLPDDEPVIRSTRIRNGSTQPLGEDGISQLIGRFYERAGVNFKGHDLRRTFCTLVRKVSGDECLSIRLLRDKVQGVNDRYNDCPPSDLVEPLERYSPLRLIRQKPADLVKGDNHKVEFNSPPSPPRFEIDLS